MHVVDLAILRRRDFILPFLAMVRDPLAQFEVEKREHELKMKKMEAEMEQVFEMKVQEKMQKLKDIEADVSRNINTVETIIDHHISQGLCFQ